MRILITTSSFGDSYTFSIDLAKSLQQMGVEVFIATSGVPLNYRQKEELKPFDYAYAEYKQHGMINPWSDIMEQGQWLMKLKNKFRPDLVQLNSMTFGSLPWGVPVVSLIHSSWLSSSLVLYNNGSSQWEKFKMMARESLSASDAVLAPTQSMLGKAENLFGPFMNSYVIPYGRSEYNFRSRMKKNYIFCNGRIHDDAQNLSLLIEAAQEIDYPIYIADNQESITKRIPDNIFLIGPVHDDYLRNWLGNASIYILPSKYESFDYSFIDAAFSKCALVGGNISSLHETWGNAMHYVENKDELVKKVNRLMENIGEKYLSGQKAYETALENYTLIKMVRRYYWLYEQMIQAKP